MSCSSAGNTMSVNTPLLTTSWQAKTVVWEDKPHKACHWCAGKKLEDESLTTWSRLQRVCRHLNIQATSGDGSARRPTGRQQRTSPEVLKKRGSGLTWRKRTPPGPLAGLLVFRWWTWDGGIHCWSLWRCGGSIGQTPRKQGAHLIVQRMPSLTWHPTKS